MDIALQGGGCAQFCSSLQFIFTLSSKYLRTHVCIAMQLPRGPRWKEHFNRDRKIKLNTLM